MKYNFKAKGDAELLRMETILENERDAKLLQMKLDPELQVINDKLDSIADEKKERQL